MHRSGTRSSRRTNGRGPDPPRQQSLQDIGQELSPDTDVVPLQLVDQDDELFRRNAGDLAGIAGQGADELLLLFSGQRCSIDGMTGTAFSFGWCVMVCTIGRTIPPAGDLVK